MRDTNHTIDTELHTHLHLQCRTSLFYLTNILSAFNKNNCSVIIAETHRQA